MKPKIGKYVDFDFWKKDCKEIEIINKEDFPRTEIVDWLSISNDNLGIVDADEIKSRIAVMKYLNDNLGIAELADEVYRSANINMPYGKDEFLERYDGDSNFWKLVNNLINAINKTNPPDKIKIFRDVLISFLKLEESEKEMSDIICDIMESSAVMEGIINFDMRIVKYNIDKYRTVREGDPVIVEEFHGHRMFSKALNKSRLIKERAIIKPIIKFINKHKIKQANKLMNINKCDSINLDIINGALKHFDTMDLSKGYRYRHNISITCYFSYGEKLLVDIIDACPETYIDTFDFKFNNFAYSKERMKMINIGRDKIRSLVAKTKNAQASYELRRELDMLVQLEIESPLTDRNHKWESLSNLYNSDDLRSTVKAIEGFNAFVRDKCYDLLNINNTLKLFKNKAKELKTTICFPEILDDGKNSIEFKELYPMHLGRAIKNKIVPVDNLGAVNGNMIGITGRHGGGKTVTEHTIVGNIFLAQSGLPVFGKEFKLNPKTHIGMVFIDGVSGKSVVQVLIEKTKNIFKGIHKVDGKKVVIVLDELGSATQEKDGMELALKVLGKINETDCSLLFSTQILEVAKEAEKRFGAKIFKVDKNHKLSRGIAGGELGKLIKETGLEKWLQK